MKSAIASHSLKKSLLFVSSKKLFQIEINAPISSPLVFFYWNGNDNAYNTTEVMMNKRKIIHQNRQYHEKKNLVFHFANFDGHATMLFTIK